MEDRLELDTSVLKEKKQIGESLTDLNNIHLFTDEFDLIIYKKEEEEKAAEQKLQEQCFVIPNIQDEEDVLKSRMFHSGQRAVSRNIQQEIDYVNYYMLLGSIFIGIVICCIVFGMADNKRSANNDIDINN
ncbi:MAG: hypothetical protein K2K56_03835 [Lachnospiraceae bacterium]|nr:hypothetical protein [Lachnospiraceae bacterium]